jgi:hypothetical protein
MTHNSCRYANPVAAFVRARDADFSSALNENALNPRDSRRAADPPTLSKRWACCCQLYTVDVDGGFLSQLETLGAEFTMNNPIATALSAPPQGRNRPSVSKRSPAIRTMSDA